MRIKFFILTFLFLFFGAEPVFAVAPTISGPQSINLDTPFTLTATTSGFGNTIYRLRVALAITGTYNYFGSTFNGNNWYNGTPSPINYANFLSVTMDNNGSWSGTIQGKVESSDPNFPASLGLYDLKIGRYTETGTSATWSNILQVSLITPSPSPTSVPTPSPSSTAIPTDTPQTTSSFTISNIPSQIKSDQSLSVNINLSMPNSQNTDYYLKGAFKKSDGTRYLGLTKKDSDWIEYGDDYSDQYKITTDSSGNWNGNVEVKPDILDNDYKGSGDYVFKVGKFTSSGSGPTWSNETAVKIVDTTNSPTPSLSSNPTPKPSTIKVVTATSSPKPTSKLTYQIASVAGAQTATPEGKVEIQNQKQTNPIIWIGLIFVFAGGSALGYIYLKKNAKIHIPFGR